MYRSKYVISKMRTSFWFEGVASIVALAGVCLAGTDTSLWLAGVVVVLHVAAISFRGYLIRQNVFEKDFSRWAITQLITKIFQVGMLCVLISSALLFGALLYHSAQTVPAVVFSAFALALSYRSQLVSVQDFLFVSEDKTDESADPDKKNNSEIYLVDGCGGEGDSLCSVHEDLRKLPLTEREDCKRGMNKIDFACREYRSSGNKHLKLVKTSLDNA